MINDAQGSTTAQPAVTATRPAIIPLHRSATSYVPLPSALFANEWAMNKLPRPPAAPLNVVTTAMRAATAAVSSFKRRVEPQLKPYQATHNKKVPNTTNGREWPSCGRRGRRRRGGAKNFLLACPESSRAPRAP